MIGGGGCYAVTPADPRFVWGGYYEDGSLIWRSRWITSDGVIECREALAYPGDAGTAVLLRRVQATGVPARVRVQLDVRAGFGRHNMTHLEHGGTWTGRSGPLYLRWSGGQEAKAQPDGRLDLTLTVAPGDRHDFVLELSAVTGSPLGGEPVTADIAWDATEAAWARELPAFRTSLSPRASRHSYGVLKGLTSSSGAMVAAATMSLPERARAVRNYDYRYAWIRDQCYAGQAVAADGPHRLLDDAVSFVASRLLADGPGLKPAYTVTGGAVPDERTLSGLAGYPGGSDKVGNWVNKQFQLDALGEAPLLFAAAARHDHLETWHWQAAETAVAGRTDAALLLPAIRGATTADDPRALATLRAIEDDLARDGYLYRFRHDQRPLHEAEGAFVLCGFLMALALHQQGQEAEAVGWFERNRAACGPPGLLTEEFDVIQRQLRGNLPQAFVHALLLESAARLARPWGES